MKDKTQQPAYERKIRSIYHSRRIHSDELEAKAQIEDFDAPDEETDAFILRHIESEFGENWARELRGAERDSRSAVLMELKLSSEYGFALYNYGGDGECLGHGRTFAAMLLDLAEWASLDDARWDRLCETTGYTNERGEFEPYPFGEFLAKWNRCFEEVTA